MAGVDRPATTKPAANSKTLDKAMQLLLTVGAAHDGLLVSELARELEMHRTSVYRLLGTMERYDVVQRRSDDRYVLGLALVQLSARVRSDLQSAAQPVLRRLATQTRATAFLIVRDGNEVVCVSVAEPYDTDIHVAYRLGLRHPIEVGPGRALLIGSPSRTDESDDVADARRHGYVVTHDELQQGAWGLTVPVLGPAEQAEAAVGVVSMQKLDEVSVAKWVLSAGQALSR